MARFFKRKNDFSKTIVILDIILFIIYITINIIMQWKRGFSMPSDINIGVFAFLTGELGLLSFIKRSKLTSEAIQNNTKTTQNTIQDIADSQTQLLLLQQQQLQQNNLHQGAG